MISTDVDPSSGTPLGGKRQVFCATVEQQGETGSIVWQRLSADVKQHNIRPMVARGVEHNMIMWLQGLYNTYTKL